MTNATLTVPVQIIALVNLSGAVLALTAHAVAATLGARRFRPYHLSVALLAAGYALGYAWLAFADVPQATWSRTMVWVGIVSWPLVWVVPAVLSLLVERRRAHVDARVQALVAIADDLEELDEAA